MHGPKDQMPRYVKNKYKESLPEVFARVFFKSFSDGTVNCGLCPLSRGLEAERDEWFKEPPLPQGEGSRVNVSSQLCTN